MASHLASLWNRGLGQLGNGLLLNWRSIVDWNVLSIQVRAHLPLRFWGFISVPKAYQTLLLDTAIDLKREKYKALNQKLVHHNRQ